jgi:hypothetical protein
MKVANVMTSNVRVIGPGTVGVVDAVELSPTGRTLWAH